MAQVAGRLRIRKTTEQLRLEYDASNYADFTVDSGGDLTIAPSGGDTSVTGTFAVSGASTFSEEIFLDRASVGRISRTDNASLISITGGPSGTGANILLYGAAHGSLADVIQFREDTTVRGGIYSGVLIMGSGSSAGAATAGGGRWTGVSQFDDETIFLDNVGIGTTGPTGKFEVHPGGSQTVGDFLVDTANRLVVIGRRSTTGGDNTRFVVRDRLDTSYLDIDTSAGTMGFFGATPVTQQTGVAVSAAGIHAALVNLGLITA